MWVEILWPTFGLQNEIPDEPVLFIKPNSALTETITLPETSCRCEGELSFLIKNGALGAVAFGLDLTLGEVQNRLKAKGLPWEKAKAFNGSAAFSPFVTFDSQAELQLELWLNGRLQQSGGVALMIHKPAEILTEIKRYFDLEDYDVVMTGTPSGVKELARGDRLHGMVKSGGRILVEREWLIG